jgi:TatA/E family protein of Tat protein translocase
MTGLLLFFNMGGGEIFLIVLVVYLVFGPKKIPELARTLGKGMNELRRATDDIKKEINKEANKIKKEVDIGIDLDIDKELRKKPKQKTGTKEEKPGKEEKDQSKSNEPGTVPRDSIKQPVENIEKKEKDTASDKTIKSEKVENKKKSTVDK